MPSTRLRDLKDEYQRLWDTCTIRSSFVDEANSVIKKIIKHRDRYESLQKQTGVPWYFVAVIHNMECGLDFSQHLHNGDSLKKRTWQEPSGRPAAAPINGWNVGYTWEESALDALRLKEFDQAKDWSLPAQLWRLEGYNGLGYRLYHPDVLTPYLWSGTNHYSRGKYTADGKWSSSAVSQQVGIAVLYKTLEQQGYLNATVANVSIINPAPVEPIAPEKGGKSTLIITSNSGTFLKISGEQSSALHDSEKEFMPRGKQLPILAWRKDHKHFVVTLDNTTFDGRNTWYIFGDHCQIKA
jgi:lysozyme family protein